MTASALALASVAFGSRGRIRGVPPPERRIPRSDWPGDERAVTRFLAGDVGAFEAIVRQYSEAVFVFSSRFVGPQEAEEVVQDTFLRAYRSLGTFRGESSLKTWLFTIAMNRARVRRGTLGRLRALFVPMERPGADESTPWVFDPADDAASPEEAASSSQRRRLLREAIRQLPDDFRTAVILRDLEGLDYAEIAEVVKVPIGTVRSRIARGRALLRERLA